MAAVTLSRPLRIAGIGVAALLLTSFFIVLGFPYERLGIVMATSIERGLGVGLRAERIQPSLSLLGLGLTGRDVHVTTRDGTVWRLDELTVRPAWSTAWLRGRPSLHVRVASRYGQLNGAVEVVEPQVFDGRATDLDLETLGLEHAVPGLSVKGRADLEGRVAFPNGAPQGPIALVVKQGTLAHPDFPMPIQYDEIRGQLVFGGDSWLRIESLDIASPLGTGAVTGTVGPPGSGGGAPLDLQLEMAAAPSIQGALRAQGVRFGEGGAVSVHVSGTTARPLVR